MKTRILVILFLAGLVLASALTTLSSTPGYMDAAYYYMGGVNLAEGKGFYEQILWNYLDSPAGLPHPSHLYWMPLPSILASTGLFLGGKNAYIWARVPFIILSGLAPLITALLAHSITKSNRKAVLAGTMALFPGFYAVFLNHTETFSPFMVLGGLFFLLIAESENFWEKPHLIRIFCLGLISGLMHLTRADGIVWYAGGFLFLLIVCISQREIELMARLKTLLKQAMTLTCGYVVVMMPWFMRNVEMFGSPLSPGGNYSLWFVDYDDLYFYPAALITSYRWLETGFSAILANRWTALIQNIQTGIFVQGEIFLFPLILVGFWEKRRDRKVQIAGILWLITFGLMTIIFPFAGERGGFFHSGAAIQPMLWALAAVGLERIIQWGVKNRNWNFYQAWNVFASGIVAISILLSGFLIFSRVVGTDYPPNKWDRDWNRYLEIETELANMDISKEEVILINNPPVYYAANQRPSIAIPDGDVEMTLAVAKRYQAKILVVEENHPEGLDFLYNHPDDIPHEFERLPSNLGQVLIYRIRAQ